MVKKVLYRHRRHHMMPSTVGKLSHDPMPFGSATLLIRSSRMTRPGEAEKLEAEDRARAEDAVREYEERQEKKEKTKEIGKELRRRRPIK